jgi:putative oxidoreductase
MRAAQRIILVSVDAVKAAASPPHSISERVREILEFVAAGWIVGAEDCLGDYFSFSWLSEIGAFARGTQMQGFFVEHGLPGYFLYIAGVIETFGGGLLLLGLFTRAAGLLLALEMCVAIWKVHSAHGYLAVNDYQFPLSLAAACFALATVGAGLISVDQFLLEGGRKARAPRNPNK